MACLGRVGLGLARNGMASELTTRVGGGPIMAIDPGPTHSGWVVMRAGVVLAAGVSGNAELRRSARRRAWPGSPEAVAVDALIVEDVRSYGQPVGQEVFDTCMFIGALAEAWAQTPLAALPPTGMADGFYLLGRPDVKLTLCGTMRAKGAAVRTALIDRFGGTREAAIGSKARPGPLYNVRSHAWSALALAVAWVAGARYRKLTE